MRSVKQVVVSGGFDDIRSRDLRFFEEAAKLGLSLRRDSSEISRLFEKALERASAHNKTSQGGEHA